MLHYISSFALLVASRKVPKYYDQNIIPKYCVEFQNIMTKIVWNLFFLLSTLPMMIQISEKVLIWLKKANFIKKPPVSKRESFWKSNFDQKLIYKTINFVILTQLDRFIFSLKIKEVLWSYRKSQKLKFEENWEELWQKICLFRHFWTKY